MPTLHSFRFNAFGASLRPQRASKRGVRGVQGVRKALAAAVQDGLSGLSIRPRLVRAVNSAHLGGLVGAINVSLQPDSAGWILVRYGVYPNQVGLQIFDRAAAEAIVSAANSLASRAADRFRGQPIYVGHPDDPAWRKANPGVRAEAVGRLPELKVSDEGLLLRPAFNDEGKRLLAGDAPAYDSFSPHWGMVPTTHQGRAAFRPVELYSIGLTNQPNIPGSWIGLNEALPADRFPVTTTNHTMNPKLIALLAVLGITRAPDATEDQLVSGINEAMPKLQAVLDAAGKVPELETKLTTAANETATLKSQLATANTATQTAVNDAAGLRTSLAAERAARADAVITTAVNEGRLTEAQRAEWAGKFSAQGADFAAVAGELAKVKKAVNTSPQAHVAGRRGAASPEAKARLTAINEAIEAKMAKMGTKDRNAAYLALKSEGHALFAATNG